MPEQSAMVLVTTSFPRSADGSEAAGGFVADLATELARHRPVRVVAPGIRTEVVDDGGGVVVYRFQAPERPLSTLRLWSPTDLLQVLRVMRAGYATTRLAVQDGAADRIIALWALPSGAWARRAAREAGIPYSVWTLGSDIWSLGRVPGIRSWLRRVMAGAHRCYSDGLKLADDSRRIAGRGVDFLPSTRRIEGRRTSAIRPEAPYRLLFLGRWHPNKGIDVLMKSLARLSEDDWARIESVDIAGGGPLEPEVKACAGALVAAGRPVRLHGFLDKPAAEAIMARADWLLIPSRIESIPVVFSDAMKLGLPVVSTPVGDLGALVSEIPDCGLLAVEAEPGAFADAIGRALRSSASVHAEGVSERAQRFDIKRIALRLLDETGWAPA